MSDTVNSQKIKHLTWIFKVNWYNGMLIFVAHYMLFLILPVCAVYDGKEASSDLSATSLPFPASNRGQRNPCLPVAPIGKLRRGELGRGRSRVPNYKVTRENQSLLVLSWYWRHRVHQTADQWVSLGRRRKEEGSGAGYCTEESVPRCVQITPKVVGDPVTCSDVLAWMFTCLVWLYACATPSMMWLWILQSQIAVAQNCPTSFVSLRWTT